MHLQTATGGDEKPDFLLFFLFNFFNQSYTPLDRDWWRWKIRLFNFFNSFFLNHYYTPPDHDRWRWKSLFFNLFSIHFF